MCNMLGYGVGCGMSDTLFVGGVVCVICMWERSMCVACNTLAEGRGRWCGDSQIRTDTRLDVKGGTKGARGRWAREVAGGRGQIGSLWSGVPT